MSEKRYFRSNTTQIVYREQEIENACHILNVDIQDVLKDFTEIHPSVIDFLKDGRKIHAVMLYRDIHGCHLSDAKEMVERIEKDMEKCQTKNRSKRK